MEQNQSQFNEPQLTKKERRMMRREERRQQTDQARKTRGRKGMAMWGIAFLVFGGLGMGVFALLQGGGTASVSDGNSVLSQCVNHGGGVSMHIHPQLRIFVNEEKQKIEENIGISSFCMKPVHTHDSTGTIHIEFPRDHDFVLADFFEVWDKSFSSTQLLEHSVDENHEIVMSVNGVENMDYERYVMNDLDEIVIRYKEKEEEKEVPEQEQSDVTDEEIMDEEKIQDNQEHTM